MTLPVTEEAAHLRIVIAETVRGIPSEILDHLFTELRLGEQDLCRGFGELCIGGALVAGLIAAHDGTTIVESTLGAGTWVTITLPQDETTSDEQPTQFDTLHGRVAVCTNCAMSHVTSFLAMTHHSLRGASMPIAPQRETYWHVTEMVDTTLDTHEPPRMQSFTVANTQPRMLRWVAEPHLETHRVVEARRQRVASGPSGVRLVLQSLKEPQRQIILHALMITLVVIR